MAMEGENADVLVYFSNYPLLSTKFGYSTAPTPKNGRLTDGRGSNLMKANQRPYLHRCNASKESKLDHHTKPPNQPLGC